MYFTYIANILVSYDPSSTVRQVVLYSGYPEERSPRRTRSSCTRVILRRDTGLHHGAVIIRLLPIHQPKSTDGSTKLTELVHPKYYEVWVTCHRDIPPPRCVKSSFRRFRFIGCGRYVRSSPTLSPAGGTNEQRYERSRWLRL